MRLPVAAHSACFILRTRENVRVPRSSTLEIIAYCKALGRLALPLPPASSCEGSQLLFSPLLLNKKKGEVPGGGAGGKK